MNTENENYFPVEPNKYQFLGLNYLTKGLDAKIVENVNKVYVCGYRVNNEIIYPFLEYLLQKNSSGTELVLPSLYLPEDCKDAVSLVSKIDTLLTLLLIGNNSGFNLNHNFVECYEGFCYFKGDMYVFFDLTVMEIKLDDVYRENALWFCLIYEIFNSGHVCGTKISNSVVTFLFSCSIKHPFYVLHDENLIQYEVPSVVYVGAHEKKINFIHTFGISKKNSDSMLGPYYYFTDFTNAIRQGGWSENESIDTMFGKVITDNEYGRYTKGGIVRFALFIGKADVKMNFKTDDIDSSQIKRERLLDTNLDTNYEKQTMRISDHDGLWTKNYDTIILEDLELDDGTRLKNTPMYVCKEYERQCPLTYHYLNKKTLGEKYDNSSHYSIM
jgi:hypothetical protein